MNHSITLLQPDYDALGSVLLLKRNPLYSIYDNLTITLDGQREQKVKYITAIHTHKVHTAYCYLELSDTRGVDDVPGTVGGGSSSTILHEMISGESHD